MPQRLPVMSIQGVETHLRRSPLFWASCALAGLAAGVLGNAVTRSDATVGVHIPVAVVDPPIGLFRVGGTTTASFYVTGLTHLEALIARTPSIGGLLLASATCLSLARMGQRLGWPPRWWLARRPRLLLLLWILVIAVSWPLLSWVGSATALTAIGSPSGVTPLADYATAYPLLVTALITWVIGGQLAKTSVKAPGGGSPRRVT